MNNCIFRQCSGFITISYPGEVDEGEEHGQNEEKDTEESVNNVKEDKEEEKKKEDDETKMKVKTIT